MLAGIRGILVITTPHEQEGFLRLLGDEGELGLRLARKTARREAGARSRMARYRYLRISAASVKLYPND
jgi:dTDP-glucose pyrophosphorylase